VNINTGKGADTIYTDGYGGEDSDSDAVWAMNFDAERANDIGDIGNFAPDDLPGEQTSLAYLGGATVTVTLSGAGIEGNLGDGGGVMTADGYGTDDTAYGATPFNDGYEVSAVIGNLINGNAFYGTQSDVNAAIMTAINDDAVLNKLLVATIEANNTLVVKSLTSGDFADVDLRVEIAQADVSVAVQSEARSVFSDSSLSITSIASANAAAGNDLTTSDSADAWYDGLSAEGDIENSMSSSVGEGESNLHSEGSASKDEVDTVINGGDGNDTMVLSTNAGSGTPDDFTVSSNNALLNGASNETIVLTGLGFGHDTVKNFTTADTMAVDQSVDYVTYAMNAGITVDEIAGEVSTVILEGVLLYGDNLEVPLTPGNNATQVMLAIEAAINGNPDSLFTAVATTNSIALTAINNDVDGSQVEFYVEDSDSTGINNVWTAEQFGENNQGVGVGTVDVLIDVINDGTDFLDFSDYLTSQDSPSGSGDSQNLIATTLQYSETPDFTGGSGDGYGNLEVEANEVAVVRMDNSGDAGETFDALSGSDVAALFNNTVGGDNAYGDLDQSDFNVLDGQSATAVVNGDAKAIFMVENADNLGEYKVFELTWDASQADGDEDVTAVEIGSLDFGDSLTYLDDVNLVGSDDHAALLTFGFA
jgi:hypothetical protein